MQVTIIGGGSYQWTPELMADLFGTESLRGMHLVLEDIDPAPLVKMEALAEKLSAEMDAKATVATTTDQRRALDGADFVIVTISTGGFESMGLDLDIPARYGIRQSVGDTVGPGGINRGLRNVPVMAGIARDVESVCPDAWFLNITNPMTVLTRTVTEVSNCKVIGLCHEVGNWCWDVALMLGLPHEAVRPTVSGVNHLPIVPSVDIDGADGIALLRELIDEVGGLEALAPAPGQEEAPQFSKLDFARRHRLQLTLLDRWGAVPAANDRHVAEFLPSILTEPSDWGDDYGIELTSIARRQEHQDTYIADVDAWLAGTKDLQTWQSGELPGPVIDSLVTGTRRDVPANIRNVGQCPDLPLGSVVESICVVDADGVRGRDQATLPAPFAELVRRHVAVQEMVVRAALDGDRSLANSAFALDPLAGRGPLADTEAMVKELLAATARWLPQFAPDRGLTPFEEHRVSMRIGFIGLGAMGLPMTRHLVEAGHTVTVASRSPGPVEAAVELGAISGDSPAAVAEASEVTILCVPNSPEVDQVVEAMLPALGAGKTLVDCSTIDPDVERAQHERVTATGAAYLDAPLSGGTAGAQAGTLTLMVGGSADDLSRTEPALRPFTGLIVHVGGPGMGQVVKLCNNLIYAAQMLATAEATALAERSGADLAKLHEVLVHATGDCVAVRTRFPVPGVVPESPASNGWAPGFMTDLMAKDLDLALGWAERVGVLLETTPLARNRLGQASAAGYGREDFSALAKVVLGRPSGTSG